MIPRRSARPEERLLVINPVMSVADQAARGMGGKKHKTSFTCYLVCHMFRNNMARMRF